MDEGVFWKTMNPARLCSLFDAHFRPRHRREISQSLQKGEKTPENGEISLSAYLMGGGG